MKYGVYAIKDVKTGFLQPTVEMNDKVAIRNFAFAVHRTKDSLFYTFPEDYSLFRIGYYETDTGELERCDLEVLAPATYFIGDDPLDPMKVGEE